MLIRKRIPAWWISVVGALIGASGAIFGGITVERLNDQIVDTQSNQRNLSQRHDTLWNSHQLADSRQQHAETIFIEAFTQNDNNLQRELYKLAKRYYRDAWITMGVAAGIEPEVLISSEDKYQKEAIKSLQERDFRSIQMKMINTMRLASQDTINSINVKLSDSATDLDQMQRKQNMAFYLGLAFTALGGIIVALKDIPLFRS